MKEINDAIDIVDDTIRQRKADLRLARERYDTDDIIEEAILVIELLELKVKMLMNLMEEES